MTTGDATFQHGFRARAIEDSISPAGIRITTVEATFPRFILAEINTHRSHSKNSASSRAIPVHKQLARIDTRPARPVSWPAEQRGMSGGDQLYGQDLADAQALWDQLCTHTVAQVRAYLDAHPDKHTRVHKSVINRLLEPFMWHTIIATADQDGWANLFAQRCSTDAQPEFAEVAHLMRDAIDESEPALLQPGQWHLPYVTDEERATHDLGTCLKLSAARCARVSYLNHDGLNELAKDLGLTDRLAAADPIHASPFEHQATPARADLNPPGNLSGWQQWRHQVEVAGVG